MHSFFKKTKNIYSERGAFAARWRLFLSFSCEVKLSSTGSNFQLHQVIQECSQSVCGEHQTNTSPHKGECLRNAQTGLLWVGVPFVYRFMVI